MSRSNPLLTVLAGAFLLSLSGPALSVEKPPPGSAAVAQGPILDPESGSYFELRIHSKEYPSRQWSAAQKTASQQTYKGRRGRLAVIKDLRTLNFVRENFRFNEDAWIGLRFYCQFRKLMWVTGELQPIKSPGMWAPSWHRTSIKCGNNRITYMPVYLTKERDGSVSWQASGEGKAFRTYLVEYPPAASEESTKDSQASKN